MQNSSMDPSTRAVAVVGVGAVLPDAPNAEAFWKNVLAGRDSISEVPANRWSLAHYYDPDPRAPGKTYSKIGGWVRDFSFDLMKFRVPPKVADAMDDGQKWVVAAAVEALKDAGHPDRPIDLESTAVILGTAMGGERHNITALRIQAPEYLDALSSTGAFRALDPKARAALLDEWKKEIDSRYPDVTEDSMPGELANVMAGRVAALLNLRGANYITDAACASSLAALETAVLGLCDHRYDAVITGGMDRNMGAPTFVKFCKIGALSPDGSRPYAKGANGFIMGEGGAVFVLKRLADAEKAKDRIYAVIRAVGASSDGKGKAITAPNPVGQILAIKRAWSIAGLSPSTMGLLEGHGTSTAVGDVVEVDSMLTVLKEVGLPKGRVALGSVKSQIGHLKSGAGAAGLLKAVLSVHHKVLPPSINFREPNPNIDFATGPFVVKTTPDPWERAAEPRRAGLSAFGFGGTNFHVVIEEHVPGLLAPRRVQSQVPRDASVHSIESGEGVITQAPDLPEPLGNVLAIGAEDLPGLRAQLVKARDEAKAGRTPGLRRPPDEQARKGYQRLMVSFVDAADLATKTEKALHALDNAKPRSWRLLQAKGIWFGRRPAPKLAFMFPGQGSQYVNMLADLRRTEPVVAETFAQADRVMEPILGRPLSSYLFLPGADAAAIAAAENALRDTTICQPAVLTCDVALTRLLAKHRVIPDFVIGHSLGEWGAVVAAGMVSFEEALVAVSARAKGMAEVAPPDPGRMASVLGPYEKVVSELERMGGKVVAANLNSTKQTVIAGPTKEMNAAVAHFNEAGLTSQFIPVSHAFHSEIVAPAVAAVKGVLDTMTLSPPRLGIVGNVDGDFYPTDMAQIQDRLSRQVASPVQFVKGLHALYRAGARLFVEVGPKRVLHGFAEDVVGDLRGAVCLSTNHPKRGDVGSFHDALCGIWSAGLPLPQGGQGTVIRSVAPPAESRTEVPSPVPAETPAKPVASPTLPVSPNAGPDYQALGKLFAEFLGKGMALYQGAPPASLGAPAVEPGVGVAAGQRAADGAVVISGASLGLPGVGRKVFDDTNVDRILSGQSFIDPVPEAMRSRMVEKNVVRLVKRAVGEPSLEPIQSTDEVVKLAARRGAFDLAQEFGVPADRIEAYDVTTSLAVAAGLEALRDAGIPMVRNYRRTTTGSLLRDRWMLPKALADETGVIFACAFPGVNRLVDELERFHSDRFARALLSELDTIRASLPPNDPAGPRLDSRATEIRTRLARGGYVFDRRFLFRILAMGHSQFAELIGARGPNTQVNAACASTTQALSLAEDWIRGGRCRRVIVIGSDDVTSDELLGWIGTGFLASGAATTEAAVEKAALPFDRRRHGMLLGMGACGIVVEAQDALVERGMRGIAELLGTEVANSAFHGTRLDVDHIVGVMERLVAAAEKRHGLSRASMAKEMVFVSHETYTPARGGSAAAEVHALRRAFGAGADAIVVANTKGFTGHPMGVGLEDAVAVKILEKRTVPPVPNFREPDPELGVLNLSRGGTYPIEYALRLAAGFGSQICMSLTRRVPRAEERVSARAVYDRWLADVSGLDQPRLEVVQRTLRISDNGAPVREPAASRWIFGSTPEARVERTEVRPPPTLERPSAPPKPAMATAPAPAAPAPTADPVAERVLGLVSEKTGYPRDMLDLDLDLEADLGVDTVKQAEVFGLVRETFDIPRQDDLKLRDYPTLKHVIGFVRKHRPDLPAATAVHSSAPTAPPASTPAPAASADPVAERVLALVSEKTGYPRDMLDLDLDLEADLGVDTVKQAEVFALVRETFNIPRQDDLKLRDYPTLKHVIGFVRKNRPDLASAPPPAPAARPSAPAPMPVAAASPAAVQSPVAEEVLRLVSEKTGYPRDMLELDLDLEADLGVDTVKQAEVFGLVRERFNIPRQEDLKLRDYPTLKHVIGFVEKHRPDLAAASSAPEVRAAAPAPVAAQSAEPQRSSAAPSDPVAAKVLALVSEKTGYPEDMLELDLDLEADLGVDTVKQAEVFGQVRETFGIPRQEDLKLRDYPTLQHVIGFVKKHRPDLSSQTAAPSAPARPTPSAAAVPATDSPSKSTGPLFRVPVPVLRPALGQCKPTAVRLSAGSKVLIVADRGGVGSRLAETLKAKGLDPLLLTDRKDPRACETKVAEWAKSSSVVGAYFLVGLDSEPALESLDLAAWRSLQSDRTRLIHAVGRALYPTLDRTGAFFLAATRLGGLHGYEPAGAKNPCGGAVCGFVKALSRERTHALVKVIDFEEKALPDRVAELLLAETEKDPGAVEIGYREGARYTVGVVPEAEARRQPVPALLLDASSVFLVTGGAGAITSAIVRDLASASKGTFHLVDALPEPDEVTRREVLKLAGDREKLKREIFEELKAAGLRATPALVEKRIFGLERAAAILEALRTVEAAGGKARYHSVDVTRAEAVAAVVTKIESEDKRLDVIVHAAGLERSRSLDTKPIEEFDLVYDVKADGLFNLLCASSKIAVRGLVCFSSVAGRFGNAGQADYSAGNDLMCKLAPHWANARPGRLAVVLDWTAWGGIGMATRGNIPELMQRAGIEMLAPDDGIPVVRRMLTEGLAGETVVGRRLGILLSVPDPDGGIDPAALSGVGRQGPRPLLSLNAASVSPHHGLRAEATLDPRAEPFLKDHAIDGTPVLPGVMGLEGFAEVASLVAPGHRVLAIEDVHFLAPLKFFRNEPRRMTFRALPLRTPDGKLRVLTQLSSEQVIVGAAKPPEEKVHFTAAVLLAPRDQSVQAPTVKPGKVAGGTALLREAIYEVYFHGPAYQVLAGVQKTEEGGLAGAIWPELPTEGADPKAKGSFAPRLIELCFQTAGVWEIGQTGQLGLPAGADRVSVWKAPPEKEKLVAEVFARPASGSNGNGEGPRFDARVRDPAGNVYVEVVGYRTAKLPGSLPGDKLAPFREVLGPR